MNILFISKENFLKEFSFKNLMKEFETFEESLRYLVETGVKIGELSISTKSHWMTCLNKYFQLMTGIIGKQKLDSSIEPKDYLGKMKPPFNIFYRENHELISTVLFSSKEDGTVALNDSWIRNDEISSTLNSSSSELRGNVIYQFPKSDEKTKIISLPISEMYTRAIFLHKNGSDDIQDKEYPFRVLYGVLSCLKFSIEEPNSFIEDNLKSLSEYNIDREESKNNMKDFGKVAAPFLKALGIEESTIPEKMFQGIDPKFMKNIGDIAKSVMEDFQGDPLSSGSKDYGSMLQKVATTLQKPEITEILGSMNEGSIDLIKTIPTSESYKSAASPK